MRLKTEFVYLAVILDGFSRKVVGWSLERTLASRLALAASEQAIAARKPAPGLVHHSDRGVQYASEGYVAVLDRHWDDSEHEPARRILTTTPAAKGSRRL
jgi:putative transposase